jgi:hypothetical protein
VSAHTSGPWHFIVENGDKKIVAPNRDGLASHETLMCDTNYYPWCPSEDADWHLIAAAPEMLKALELVRMSNGWRYMSPESQAVIVAATAKATGSQS